MGAREVLSFRTCCGLILAAIALSGCGSRQSIQRVVLLAPFEGRYSEIGYNAYYAAKLAIQEMGDLNTELLAVDDGGTAEMALDRLRALEGDPLVRGVIVLGFNGAEAVAQHPMTDVPSIVVGEWGIIPSNDQMFILSSPALREIITTPPIAELTTLANLPEPFTGGELVGLEQFTLLRPQLEGVTFVSSGSLPDQAFRTRYKSSGLYVPEPNHLATLVYDAVGYILRAGDIQQYEGINGSITFENGYWKDAPIYYYGYDSSGHLILVKDAQPSSVYALEVCDSGVENCVYRHAGFNGVVRRPA